MTQSKIKNSSAKKLKALEKLYAPYKDFKKSPLYIEGSNSIVFGEGDVNSTIMFIGEGPGKQEDLQGRPFVGRSGKLLDRALFLAGLPREKVFITNIVKCRPPNNRNPLPAEMKIGKELLLYDQIKIIDPKVICTLGSISLKALIEKPVAITQLRGKPIEYNGRIILPTYHPAYILRNRSNANIFLEDIIKAITLSKK